MEKKENQDQNNIKSDGNRNTAVSEKTAKAVSARHGIPLGSNTLPTEPCFRVKWK